MALVSVEERLALLSVHHGADAGEGQPWWKGCISICHGATSEQHGGETGAEWTGCNWVEIFLSEADGCRQMCCFRQLDS